MQTNNRLLFCAAVAAMSSLNGNPVFADPTQCALNAHANTIHVRQGEVTHSDGRSWGSAFTTVTAALAHAANTEGADQIWIARGVYTEPTLIVGDNTTLIGGFYGDEASPLARNPSLYRTTLSPAGSARHILYTESATGVALASLTVSGGRATGDLADDGRGSGNAVRGGGLLAYDSTLSLCDMTFTDNQARKHGGGVYVESSELSVVSSVFEGNSVLRGPFEIHDSVEEADTDGGAVAAHDSLVRIDGTSFTDNVAGDDGAAIAGRKLDITVENSVFERNKGIAVGTAQTLPVFTDDIVTSMGGAVSIQNEYLSSGPADQGRRIVIRNSRFVDNHSAIGSALFVLGAPGSETRIEHCRFHANGGSGQVNEGAPVNETGVRFGRGAAAVLLVGSRAGDRTRVADGSFARPLHKAVLQEARFTDNQAGQGGALVLISLDTVIENSLFRGNEARMRGGAIWNQNFFALFDQFAGLSPDLGKTTIRNSGFVDNAVLGIEETLQADSFPGVATNEEQTYGGGAISNDQYGILEVVDSVFVANRAINSDGGAIQNASSPVIAYQAAAAPEFYPGRLHISGSGFYGNRVSGSGSGGAIANGGNQVNGSIPDATLADRRSDALGAHLAIDGSRFMFNSAVDNGGAIASWNGAFMSLRDSMVVKNVAHTGGGISIAGHPQNPSHYSLPGSRIRANRANVDDNLFVVNTCCDKTP